MCNRGTERAERVDRSAEELREGRVAAFCRCNWFSGSSVFGENSSEKKCTGSGLFSFKSGNPQNILNESHTVSHCFLGREKRFIGSENFEIKTATWIESSHPDESEDHQSEVELSKVRDEWHSVLGYCTGSPGLMFFFSFGNLGTLGPKNFRIFFISTDDPGTLVPTGTWHHFLKCWKCEAPHVVSPPDFHRTSV